MLYKLKRNAVKTVRYALKLKILKICIKKFGCSNAMKPISCKHCTYNYKPQQLCDCKRVLE